MYHLKDKVYSCNGRVKGHGEETYKCMNPEFWIVQGEIPRFICRSCHKEYSFKELQDTLAPPEEMSVRLTGAYCPSRLNPDSIKAEVAAEREAMKEVE